MVASSPSPYRLADTPLFTRERQLEQELASAREMLDALANEEARIERGVRLREIEMRALDEVRETIRRTVAAENAASRELASVRAELVARGERKEIAPNPVNDSGLTVAWIVIVAFAVLLVSGMVFGYLRTIDTAERAPKGLDWGGPLDPGESWLYVEGPPGATFTVDGRLFQGPNHVAVSALHSHEVVVTGSRPVTVRWIPCTTALVSYGTGASPPSVERFYNSNTCF